MLIFTSTGCRFYQMLAIGGSIQSPKWQYIPLFFPGMLYCLGGKNLPYHLFPKKSYARHLCQVERHRLEDEAKEKPMRSLDFFFGGGRKLCNGYTHDGSMGMVYLPIFGWFFMVNVNSYAINWILWDRCGGYTSSEIYPLWNEQPKHLKMGDGTGRWSFPIWGSCMAGVIC